MTPAFSRFRFCALAVVLVHAAVAGSAASLKPDDEFTFAAGLVQMGFPDLANKVMQELVRLQPDQAERALVIKAEGFIAARKFTDAEAVLRELPATSPKADAIRLAIANGYFRFNEMEKARALYGEFFAKYNQPPTDPDLKGFYRDAAMRFSQMLKNAGDREGAVNALDRALATNPEKGDARALLVEQAQLLVDHAATKQGEEREKLLGRAWKICEDIQWGGVDLSFGQSIIAMANIEILRGNRERAMRLLKDEYKEMFDQIDRQLRDGNISLAFSPLAGARYLLGQLYQQDADAIADDAARRDDHIRLLGQALGEFYNVFVQYGESDWGPQAGVRANELKGRLEALGKTVKIDLGAQAEKAAATQFRLADNLYRQRDFNGAIAAYLRALNAYPETDASLRAIGALLTCYIEVGDPLMVRVVAEYLAERFAGREGAGTALLAAASVYINRKDESAASALYDVFLRGFPKHERAGAILFYMASQRRKSGDDAGANAYLQQIVDTLPQDQFYPRALQQMAAGYYKAGEHEKALAGFQKLVGDIAPSPERASAQFSLADCLIRLGRWKEAIEELDRLIGWIAPKDNPYGATTEDRAANRLTLERAVFQRANCFARISEPAAEVPSFRERGIKAYELFIQLFPESELAPKAMMGKGQIQLGLGQYDAATKTFDELAAKYPNSEEGKNALFSLARSAMEVGQLDSARGAFEKMLADAGRYKPEEFTRIGQLMTEAKLFAEAEKAYRQVLDNPAIQQAKDLPENRALLERALFGLGNALFVKRDYEGAIQQLEKLLADYPKSGLFYEAKFILGEAYGELGNVMKASEQLGDIFRFGDDPVLMNRASLKLAEIQVQAGDKVGALASYQRIALLADPNKAELRPFISEAILASLPVAMELGRYKDVVENCDLYVKHFPTSDRVTEVRRVRAEANLKASAGGVPATP